MKNWIRWSGLIGFVVISAVLIAGWLFAAGPVIKYAIETFGSDANGAKVDVADVALTFDPFGIEISGVEVANSDAPMENLVQFDRAVADIELLPLLLGKGIVNEVAVTGLAFSTARTESGAIVKTAAQEAAEEDEAQEQAEDTAGFAEQSIPSADELLEREQLLTEQRGKQFKATAEASKQKVNDAVAALPNSDTFASYEDDFNRIVNGKFKSLDDFKKRKQEFDDLKKRIAADRKAVAEAQQVIKNQKSELQSQWKGLQSAPEEDFKNLKGKYRLDAGGAANLSRLLFGDEVGEYSDKAMYWYEKVRPYLVSDETEEAVDTEAPVEHQRAAGRFVHFPTDRPLPDFLIRKVQLALELEIGTVDVQVLDITHQQNVIGRTTKLIAIGDKLNGIRSLKLNGDFDHRQMPGTDTFDLTIRDFQLKNQNLGAMGLKMDSAMVQVLGQAEVEAGRLNANVVANFQQAKFSTKDRTTMAKETVAALAKIPEFDVQGKANGELTAPDVSITSDLDKKLSNAFNQRIDEKQAELEQQLKEKLNDKLLSYAGDYKEQLAGLDLANGSLSESQDKLKSLAIKEIGSWQAQQKREAQEKLDRERKAAEAKAAEEKRKAQAKIEAEKRKAKAEADKKRKELEKQAQEKLKKLF